MSLSIRVEDLARAVVCLDTTDLPALVRLQDELTDVAASIEEADKATLVSACQHAAEAIDAIVLRTTDDAEAALSEIMQTIEYAQQVVDACAAGSNAASVPPPECLGIEGTASAEPEVDLELLSAWVSSCSSALSDLESAVVSIDAGDEDSGQVAESRRIIHTIKGEAGILSLGTIQEVCHDCETLIDLASENGGKFPVEEILGIIDWVRACIAVLSEDPTATLPPHEELHETIRKANSHYETESKSSETTTAGESAVGATTSDKDSLFAEDAEQALAESPAITGLTESVAEDITGSTTAPASDPAFEDPDGPVEFPPEAVIDDTTPDFVCEAREHIANAEQSLLELESDLANLELINTVFRAFHTIKGVAGFMHLTPIVRMTHAAETLLDQARSGTLDLTPAHLDLFLRSCDVLAQFIRVLQDGEPPLRSIYEKLMGHLDHACETGEAPEPNSGDSTPTADAPVAAESPARTETPTQSGVSEEGTAPEPAVKPEGKIVPVPQAESKSEPASKPEPSPAPQPAAEVKPTQPKPKAKAANRIEQTVKVNTGRMDALVDMVGELVIGYQMIHQDEAIRSVKEQRTKRSLGHVSKIIRDLQEVAMSLRLVTLRSTFQKMARLVRDVSAKSGKTIRLHLEGEDVELDRTVVEEIADPLVHMIRNACDHGIGTAADRRAAGKTPEGNLYLRAYHQGGSVVVEIADDGRGLNREKILEKAVSKGLYAADRNLGEIPDKEVFNLIFAPGFSTAAKVTDISGRGVGMDVVRRNIEALRGKVEITSEAGKGSTFKMRLPLTMAIIDGMVVRVGSQRYVIPTLSIEQSFRPKPGDVHTVIGRGEMVEVRENLLPVYRAKQVFGLADGTDDFQESLLVVLEAHNARFCLLVDEIVGQQQVVIKNLGQGITPIRGVSGGAILGDGRVALILDVGGIIEEATEAAA